MQRRLAAVAGIPMSLMTIHSMFFFISGSTIGKLYWDRFIVENGQFSIFILVCVDLTKWVARFLMSVRRLVSPQIRMEFSFLPRFILEQSKQ